VFGFEVDDLSAHAAIPADPVRLTLLLGLSWEMIGCLPSVHPKRDGAG